MATTGKPAKKARKQVRRQSKAPIVFALLRRRKVAYFVITAVVVLFILSVIFAYPAADAPVPVNP